MILQERLSSCTLFQHEPILSVVPVPRQGYCNENYTVTTYRTRYIVRRILRKDIDRAFEWHIQQLAYAEGIAAKPLVFDRENGLMISEYLEGVHQNRPDLQMLKHLAGTVRKLHGITIDAKPMELQTDTSAIACYPKEYVLCHNDLNPRNILFSDAVKFIDWEYAGVNDRYFDLACVCVEFGLEDEMAEVFLEAYFEGAYNLEKLEAYKIIYKNLCEAWFQQNLQGQSLVVAL